MKRALRNITLTLLVTKVISHGTIICPEAQPAPTNTKDSEIVRYGATNADVFGGRMQEDDRWEYHNAYDNCEIFKELYIEEEVESLASLFDGVIDDCAYTDPDTAPVTLEGTECYDEGMLFFQHIFQEPSQGFPHSGPCEVHINDEVVFFNYNCRDYTDDGLPGKIPVDYSKCEEGQDCMLKFYYIALHEPDIQYLKQCVPLAVPASSTTQDSESTADSSSGDGDENKTQNCHRNL